MRNTVLGEITLTTKFHVHILTLIIIQRVYAHNYLMFATIQRIYCYKLSGMIQFLIFKAQCMTFK